MDTQNNTNNSYSPDSQYNPNVQYDQYAQNNPNVQVNPNMQYTQNNTTAVNGIPVQGAEPEKKDDPAQDWKAAVGIGVVNIILAIVCGSFRIRILSVGFVAFLLGGLYCSFDAIKGGLKVKKPMSVLLGIVGMVMNVAAAVYYLWSIIYTIGSKFN